MKYKKLIHTILDTGPNFDNTLIDDKSYLATITNKYCNKNGYALAFETYKEDVYKNKIYKTILLQSQPFGSGGISLLLNLPYNKIYIDFDELWNKVSEKYNKEIEDLEKRVLIKEGPHKNSINLYDFEKRYNININNEDIEQNYFTDEITPENIEGIYISREDN